MSCYMKKHQIFFSLVKQKIKYNFPWRTWNIIFYLEKCKYIKYHFYEKHQIFLKLWNKTWIIILHQKTSNIKFYCDKKTSNIFSTKKKTKIFFYLERISNIIFHEKNQIFITVKKNQILCPWQNIKYSFLHVKKPKYHFPWLFYIYSKITGPVMLWGER